MHYPIRGRWMPAGRGWHTGRSSCSHFVSHSSSVSEPIRRKQRSRSKGFAIKLIVPELILIAVTRSIGRGLLFGTVNVAVVPSCPGSCDQSGAALSGPKHVDTFSEQRGTCPSLERFQDSTFRVHELNSGANSARGQSLVGNGNRKVLSSSCHACSVGRGKKLLRSAGRNYGDF